MLEQMAANGIELPEKLANPPALSDGLEWYLDAWQELSCDRQIGFGPGPIPSWAIRAFARDHGLTDEERDDLTYLIRRLDNVFLEHAVEQAKQSAKKE